MCCAEHAQRVPSVSGVNDRGPSGIFSFNGVMAGLPSLKEKSALVAFLIE